MLCLRHNSAVDASIDKFRYDSRLVLRVTPLVHISPNLLFQKVYGFDWSHYKGVRARKNEVKPDFRETTKGWDEFSKLDFGTKYCVVDTMVVLPMHQGDVDVLGDVKLELNNAILVLLDRIVIEAVHKHDELEGTGNRTDFDDFVASLSSTLRSAGIKFKFIQLGKHMWIRSLKIFDSGVHQGLSKADYALFLAAIKCQNMDIMTDDKALIGAINAKRGQNVNGRIRTATANYNKRRASTVWSIKRNLGRLIPEDMSTGWDCRLKRTEFLMGKAKIASIDHKNGNVSVDLRSIVKMSDKDLLVLQHKLSMQIRNSFFKWRPRESKRGATDGPARKKDWYRAHKDDDSIADGLNETQRKSVARKLRNKRVVDLDI